MTDIILSGDQPLTIRVREHQTTRSNKIDIDQAFVAKENGIQYFPQLEYIGPSKDDPDFVR